MKIKILICILIVTLFTGCTDKSKRTVNTEGAKLNEETTKNSSQKKEDLETEVETEFETEGAKLQQFFVNFDYLNVRKEPSVNSELVGKLYKNEIVRLKPTDDENWMELEDGYYVSSMYVSPIEEGAEKLDEYQLEERFIEDTIYGMITDVTGNIRDLPDLENSKILINLSHGTTLNILGICKSNWFMVKYSDESVGYISGEVFTRMTTDEYNNYTSTPQKMDFDPNISELIGSYTTNYSPVATNRGYNVEKGANEINSFVIIPGATFNWCRDMGPCGEAEGYKSSNEISNGQYVTGFGGGICQISSTLCAAVITSGKDFSFIERHQHSKAQKYIPRDLDATVSYPGTNLVIQNCNDFPVMIKTHYENGNITIELYKLNN